MLLNIWPQEITYWALSHKNIFYGMLSCSQSFIKWRYFRCYWKTTCCVCTQKSVISVQNNEIMQIYNLLIFFPIAQYLFPRMPQSLTVTLIYISKYASLGICIFFVLIFFISLIYRWIIIASSEYFQHCHASYAYHR